jgi:hypothetical protein
MLIDCDSCAMRDLACGDCVVTVMLGMPSVHGVSGPGDVEGSQAAEGQAPVLTRIELDGPERAAIAVLAGQGLVPPLRLVPKGEAGELPPSVPGATEGTGSTRRGKGTYENGMLPGAETA